MNSREREIKRDEELEEMLKKVREIHAHVFPKEEESESADESKNS